MITSYTNYRKDKRLCGYTQYNKISKTSIRFMNTYSKLSRLYIPNLFIENLKPIGNDGIKKACVFKYSVQCNEKTFNETNDFEYKIMALRSMVNKGVVSNKFFTSVIEDLENNKINVSQSLSITLLKCCGNIMYYTDLKTRQNLSKRVLNLLKYKNFTIDHYHTLLQTHIDNVHLIDPYKFLKEMIVAPEYKTYCLLLRLLSITDTNKSVIDFISHMRENNCLFGEEEYNALVYSYSALGDLTKAKEVINSMEEANITPSLATHTQLLYGFAKIGDIEGLTEILTTKTIPLLDIMKLIKFLSLCKNGEHISDILRHTQAIEKPEKDVIAVIVQLVHEKCYFDAYEIVTKIPTKDNDKTIRKKLASYFLKEMISLNINQEDVLKFIVMFAMKHDIGSVWKNAIQFATNYNNDSLAFAVFEKMKENNRIIMPYYYWFLFTKAAQKGEEHEIYSIMRHMLSLNVTLDNRTWLEYVFPYISTSNPVLTIEKMLHNGLATSYTVPHLIKFLLNSYKLKECLDLCKRFKKKINCHDMLDSLVLNYKQSKDIDSCIELLLRLSYNGQGFAGTFLVKLVQQPDFEENDVENVIKLLYAMKKNKAFMSVNDINRVEKKIFHLNLSDYNKFDLSQLFIDVTANPETDNFNSGKEIHPTFMNLEQLKTNFSILKMKGLNARGTIRLLLMASCKENDIEQVHSLLNEIKINNIQWTPGMMVLLFNFYIKNKMCTEALSELNNIQSTFPNFKIDNFKIIEFIILLVKENKINKAMNVIREFDSVNHRTNAHLNCIKLFNTLVECNYSDYVKQMADLLVRKGYCRNSPFIWSHIFNISMTEDKPIELVVSECREYVETFNYVPAKQEILTKLIKLDSKYENRSSLIKDVYSMIVKVHGKETAITNLMISLAQCDKTKELQDLFVNNHMSAKTLLQEFKYLPENDIVKVCLIMLKIGGNILKQNLEPICYLVLTIYIKRDETEAAVKLKENMLQKGVRPSKQFKTDYTALINKYKFPLSED
ncbi:leucine-rich PPR motif-containing protein, mitochondrial-like [Nomia melanderi]|uniref:leucine-rich PPR motif-containing protein, mitochondrial-like n=1 Tax=Nomia melanderi TaxID=2448451 RepID=UPI003FCED388